MKNDPFQLEGRLLSFWLDIATPAEREAYYLEAWRRARVAKKQTTLRATGIDFSGGEDSTTITLSGSVDGQTWMPLDLSTAYEFTATEKIMLDMLVASMGILPSVYDPRVIIKDKI